MNSRGVCIAALLATLPAAAETARVYTNEDLAHMKPLRGETGVLAATGQSGAPETRDSRGAERGREASRRREADRTRERTRPPRQAGRNGCAGRSKSAGGSPASRRLPTPSSIDWRRELKEVEAEIREHQDRLEERARRDGALPGWFR